MAIASAQSAADFIAMPVVRPIRQSRYFLHLCFVGLVLLAGISMLVASMSVAPVTCSNDCGSGNSRAKFLSLSILDFEQLQRRPVPTRAVVDLFCLDQSNAQASASFPALSCPRRWTKSLSSDDQQPNCIRRIPEQCAEDQVADFAGIKVTGQQRPKLYGDWLAIFDPISTVASRGSHTFTSSNGTSITYTLIMAFNASRDAFGPQVYMDAGNKAAVCAISPSDTETISGLRNSLADAFVQEAGDPGRGFPRVNVERSIADNWATEATNGILSRCLLAKNGGAAPIMMAAHGSGH
ncbi:hypothetical protein [Bradyrhizobium sp. CCBAU 51753]|uniref:hypothetical protein n=1 Tax=Bradyrhizobium sp. CCBAU 51753 TaxID=1325100 RepID=UPI00188AE154|nr:hypothetical protein [Bradyrhizobium sp. CCBAU 51753]QOZ24179.1 hypothetical protein XH93_11795 [Bradyrhizobium sp. CCBAU 51753]